MTNYIKKLIRDGVEYEVVGGSGGGSGFKNISDTEYFKGILKRFNADGQSYELKHEGGLLTEVKSGDKTYKITYFKGRLHSVTEI